MRILIVTIGSRGDVAPFTGLGTALGAAGHEVAIASHEIFRDLVVDCGLEFRPLPGDPSEKLASEKGQRYQQGGPVRLVRFLQLIGEYMGALNQGILTAARQGTDVMLLSGLGIVGGYHIAEGLGLPSMGLALQPLHPTGEFPPSTLTTRSFGHLGNRAAARASLFLTAATTQGATKRLRAELGLPPLGPREILDRQESTHWPIYHGFSPAVVPRPPDWREGLEVVGYWWPVRPTGWTPPQDLVDFLDAGPAPVYVGFGSMNPGDGERVSQLVATVARRLGVRMVIQAGWARLSQADHDPDRTMLIGDMPHDWLFPRMAAVVHHAGAGTAGAGLRAGVPAVPVPLTSDQPFWAARLVGLGVAPVSIPHEQLTADSLTLALSEAVTGPSYRQKAQEMAGRLAGEDGAKPILAALSNLQEESGIS